MSELKLRPLKGAEVVTQDKKPATLDEHDSQGLAGHDGGVMETIWQDVRFGFRMLMKHRVASLVCVVALALGIGANAAIFSMAEAFLVHPVPFENGNRMMGLIDSHTAEGGGGFGSL